MHPRRRAASRGAGLTAALLALAAVPAAAAPVPVAAERVIVDFQGTKGRDPGTLAHRLEGNCTPVFALAGWSVDFDGIDGTWASGILNARGALDVAGRRGRAASRGGGLRFETQLRKRGDGRPKSLSLTHVGVELAGARAYMTARLSPSKAQRRVGLIRRPKLLVDQLHQPDRTRADIPNTFAVAVQGKLVLTKVLARELDRRRCRDLASQGSGRVRAGKSMGRFTAQLLASRATGLAGTIPVAVAVSANSGTDVTATDAAGTPLPLDDDGIPSIPLASVPGTATPLACTVFARFPTQDCTPFGGTAALSGAIVLRLGTRATTVANLAIAYGTDDAEGTPSRTLTATLDGAPITLGTSEAGRPGLETTPAALAALSAALGEPVDGGLFPGAPVFTRIGPP